MHKRGNHRFGDRFEMGAVGWGEERSLPVVYGCHDHSNLQKGMESSFSGGVWMAAHELGRSKCLQLDDWASPGAWLGYNARQRILGAELGTNAGRKAQYGEESQSSKVVCLLCIYMACAGEKVQLNH